MHVEICPICKGTGRPPKEMNTGTVTCHGCNGRGWIEVNDVQLNNPYPWYPYPYQPYYPPWPYTNPYPTWITSGTATNATLNWYTETI